MLEDMLLGLGIIAGVYGIQFEDYEDPSIEETEDLPENPSTPLRGIDFL